MNKDSSASPKAGDADAAREAGLLYTSDDEAGIHRQRRGHRFRYVNADRTPVTEPEVLKRIKDLVLPPAWENVWICRFANGHLQATGRDARGRKQYRYHSRWRETRDESKFHRLLEFARILPRIRRRVRQDLKHRGTTREAVLATVVSLLEATLIRVGNDEYARANHSYGLTTMRNRHVKVTGSSIEFGFRGKSGRRHDIRVCDARLARIVRRCQDMPGQRLFSYTDEAGTVHRVGSHDVNGYLHELAGGEFTAKDFRTWAATVLAARALHEFEPVSSPVQAAKNVVTAIKAVARTLGNTPAVCRKCYVHPAIIEAYGNGITLATVQHAPAGMSPLPAALKAAEKGVVRLLQWKAPVRKAGNGRTHPASPSGAKQGKQKGISC